MTQFPVRGWLGFAMALPVAVLQAQGLPTAGDADVQALLERLKPSLKPVHSGPEQVQLETAVQAFLQQHSLEGSSLKVFRRLSEGGLLERSSLLKVASKARLQALSKDPGGDGAEAAALGVMFFPDLIASGTDPETGYYKPLALAYLALLAHPGLKNVVKRESAEAFGVFSTLLAFNPRQVREYGLLPALLPVLEMNLRPSVTRALYPIFELAMDPDTHLDPALQQDLRTRVLARTDDAITHLKLRGAWNMETWKTRGELEQARTWLQGAWAQGRLIGHPMPSMSVKWCTPTVTASLSGLQGKVRVLEFWNAWSNPSRLSVLKQLQERYREYPVTLIGVSGLQGQALDPATFKPVDVRDHPEREIALIQQGAGRQGMDWPLLILGEAAPSPDLGLRDLPALIIVDATGRVRRVGLRTEFALKQAIRCIDELLKEASLPVPAPLS